jgi:hypothetical protein
MRYDTPADLLRGNRAFKLAQSEGTNTLLEVDGMEVTGLRLPEPLMRLYRIHNILSVAQAG